MSIIRRLLKFNQKKIDSDFLNCYEKYKTKNIIFIDLGCRGENPKLWPKRGLDIHYVGIDASKEVIDDLTYKYKNYSGNVKAKFIQAIVSNNTDKQVFASSPEGMTDGLVITNPEDNINSKDITLKTVQPVLLRDIISDIGVNLDLKGAIKILKIDIEGNSSFIVNDDDLMMKFDIVLAELLPQLKRQFSTMSYLEENNFTLKDIKRAYKWTRKSTKELIIMDTEWINNRSLNLIDKQYKNPSFLSRGLSLVLYLVISLLFRLTKNKAYSSISDSELGW